MGRDVGDLVKPAYRALFRKSVTRRLEGQEAPRRLEIQLINGERAGLWVEAQSSTIEFHGRPAIRTGARDVSHRKSLDVSLSRSKRAAQYTLESIGEGIITTDNDGHIDYMNGAAEALIGTNRDDADGHRRGDRPDRHAREGHAGVGKAAIQATKPGDDVCHTGIDLVRVGDVADPGFCIGHGA